MKIATRLHTPCFFSSLILKRGLLKKRKVFGSKFFPFRVVSFSEGRQKKPFDRVAPQPLNSCPSPLNQQASTASLELHREYVWILLKHLSYHKLHSIVILPFLNFYTLKGYNYVKIGFVPYSEKGIIANFSI